SAIERGDDERSARYALAGWRAAPENAEDYRAALAAVLYRLAETRVLIGHAKAVAAVAFSPDAARAATASWDGTARLWDTQSGREIAVMRTSAGYVMGVLFSPDGRRIITAGEDLRLWDAATGRAIGILTTHSMFFEHVVFSPDSARVAVIAF